MKSTMKEAHVNTDKQHDKTEETQHADELKSSPRLPHERDESFDQQSDAGGEVRQSIKQAHDDIQEGQLDTDRRGMPGVEEVRRDDPDATQKKVPASSHMPSSTPKK
ncbi:MAG TPA: hypothetical protein VN114_09425 [Oxalicibacterium sp.]|uniref:hypothetical protein n=1 Tax=Oxalicibacterium sp. TaxID=2766525 RepID=UPI002C6745F4|nr:hypothetical protein [Oxalicibacterium sp.]HWU98721.1 hypothetical protein [Oxalicibacterium sp.]